MRRVSSPRPCLGCPKEAEPPECDDSHGGQSPTCSRAPPAAPTGLLVAPRSHAPITDCVDSPGPECPDLALRAHLGLAWTPTDGLYNLCQVGPSWQNACPPPAATADRASPCGISLEASARMAALAVAAVLPGARAVTQARPLPAAEQPPQAEKDPDRTRANDPEELSMVTECAGQRCVAAVRPTDKTGQEQSDRDALRKAVPRALTTTDIHALWNYYKTTDRAPGPDSRVRLGRPPSRNPPLTTQSAMPPPHPQRGSTSRRQNLMTHQ